MLKERWKIKLKANRVIINFVDSLILKSLGFRMDACERIGEIKGDRNLPIYDPEREDEIILSKLKLAEKYGLGGNFVINLFKSIIRESKRLQNKIVQRLRDR